MYVVPILEQPQISRLKKKHIFQCCDMSEKNVFDNRRKLRDFCIIMRNWREIPVGCFNYVKNHFILWVELNNNKLMQLCHLFRSFPNNDAFNSIKYLLWFSKKKTWINNDLCPVLFLCKYDHFCRSARLFGHDLCVTLAPNDLDLHIIFNV